MADKPSDPAADLIELKAYIDNFSKTAWHKSAEDAVRELTLLQQKADAAVAQVGKDMPDDVVLWANGIARDAAKAVDAAKALDPALAGSPRDEPALVELTRRLDQIASNAEYAANGIKAMPPPAPPGAPPSAPPDIVDEIDLTGRVAPAPPDLSDLDDWEPAPLPTDVTELIDSIADDVAPGEPVSPPEIVPNPVPLHEREAPMPSPMPGTSHHVIEGSEQSMLPDLVPEPDLSALPVESPYEEPGIWNPELAMEPEPGHEPPLGDDLA